MRVGVRLGDECAPPAVPVVAWWRHTLFSCLNPHVGRMKDCSMVAARPGAFARDIGLLACTLMMTMVPDAYEEDSAGYHSILGIL